MVKKISLERLCTSSSFSNLFERNLTIEKVTKFYLKFVSQNHVQTSCKIFTFFFYFLEGFLRRGLRQSIKMRLSDYFVNLFNFDLWVGQTHFVNSTNLNQLANIVVKGSESADSFINPLLYVRIGKYYFSRSALIHLTEDLSSLFENQTLLINNLSTSLGALDSLFSNLYSSLIHYYNSITFSH